MKLSLKLGRIFGIEVGVHISWIIIVIIVLLSLASYFSTTQTSWPVFMQLGAAVLCALLFFISIVTHELGHSLMARHYGIEVKSITLFLFGGVSQLQGETKHAAAEFWIAIVGPLTSLAIAGLFGIVSLFTGLGAFTREVATWLANVNLALALFNLLPGLPLDGGHVLRGFVWWLTKDVKQANRIAAIGGQVLAMLMIFTGIMIFFETKGGFSGLWLAFLGWFLLDAARANFQQNAVGDVLKTVTVADLMTKDCPEINVNLSLSQFVNNYLLRTGRRFFIVTSNGNNIGIITATDLRAIKPQMWPFTTVGDIMHEFDKLVYVSPETTAYKALELMSTKEVTQLPVVSEGHILGIVTQEHFMQLLAMHIEFAQNSDEISTAHLMKPV